MTRSFWIAALLGLASCGPGAMPPSFTHPLAGARALFLLVDFDWAWAHAQRALEVYARRHSGEAWKDQRIERILARIAEFDSQEGEAASSRWRRIVAAAGRVVGLGPNVEPTTREQRRNARLAELRKPEETSHALPGVPVAKEAPPKRRSIRLNAPLFRTTPCT